MHRITAALLCFVAIVGISDLVNWGHGFGGLIACVLVYFLLLGAPKAQRITIHGWLWLSVPMAAIAVYQLWFTDRPRGLFLSANVLGVYACLNLYLWAILHEQRWLPRDPWIIIANTLMVALSQSRGAMVACAAGLIVALRKERWLALGAASFCAMVVTILSYHRDFLLLEDPRIGMWWIGLHAAMERPLFGWGQGGLSISGVGKFYNVPLEWLLAAGVLGLSAWVWMVVETVRAALILPEPRRSAALGFIAAWLAAGTFLFNTGLDMLCMVMVMAVVASWQATVIVLPEPRKTRFPPGMRPRFLDQSALLPMVPGSNGQRLDRPEGW